MLYFLENIQNSFFLLLLLEGKNIFLNKEGKKSWEVKFKK